MLKLYDISTARRTILRRQPLAQSDFPPSVLERTAQLFGAGVTPPQAVAQILESVRRDGDAALHHWSRLLDGADLDDFRLPADALRRAWQGLPGDLRQAMQTAAERIRSFHAQQPLPNWESHTSSGRLGQRFTPLESVGVYVPGGTAPLPSSLLMSVIPAQVAGVKRIVVCTPPGAEAGRQPDKAILAAAYLCQIGEVFLLGGAQAIAALAFGSASVPRVDKIVGAGNLFVTLAKQQVYGIVGLDGLAGPTETLVIADSTADPSWVAADLLAQAEHDILASAILITPDRDLAHRVQAAVSTQLEGLSRAAVIVQALDHRSGIVITPDLETAVNLANEYAPEHLCLAVSAPDALAVRVRNAGGVFLGEFACEVLGDYVAGPSHVMPTGGSARFASPLNVFDFGKITSIVALGGAESQSLVLAAARLAQAEGLTAHAAAAEIRLQRAPA